MAGLATVGAVVTAYLTVIKFTQGSTVCPTKGCDIVLASSYATVFGLPLALFGFLAYTSTDRFRCGSSAGQFTVKQSSALEVGELDWLAVVCWWNGDDGFQRLPDVSTSC